jgi:two-component system, NtrC family, nitrogen regulation sensor histidine kinase GlnL
LNLLPTPPRYVNFDALATLVAVVNLRSQVLFANAALEDALGTSRRLIEEGLLIDHFVDPRALKAALEGVASNAFATLRYDASLKKNGADHIPVHVIIAQTEGVDEVIVEMLPLQQQSKLEREERLVDQAQANKELIRNLAHEIKNPLGGIRGAAQLLQLELDSKELREYTQVIIHEADRLQTLVDRLLAPHRKPHVVADVNIHEVCERVRSLIVAEFQAGPKDTGRSGLRVVRDYDTSIPDFRGDKEQLIQVVLNIAHNAAQVLGERMAQGDAVITLKTRIARQVTFGKRRYKLALELHIVDNGPGIPDDIKDRIFYPLVSGREGGSGLGLTLAQTFIQQHDGLIECESQPGRTEFKILIPLP